MSRAGGKLIGDAWLTRCKALRPGDVVLVAHYAPAMEPPRWYGGEALVVSATAATGLRDGYQYVWIYAQSCPSSDRQLCIRLDDYMTLASRETVEKKYEKPKVPKAVKGEQLKLF